MTKNRRPLTSVVTTDLPQDYIKATYLRANGRASSMAGFEAGEPEVKLITNSRTGKKSMRLTLNGFITINKDGSCLILDTLHNRLKLKALCQDLEQKVPRDSTGKEYDVINKGPDFEVEDESIFDGLEEASAAALEATKVTKAIKPPKLKKGKGIVPAPAKQEGPKEDNADGVGGTETGRRPENVDLDIEA